MGGGRPSSSSSATAGGAGSTSSGNSKSTSSSSSATTASTTTSTKTTTTTSKIPLQLVVLSVAAVCMIQILYLVCLEAYKIRLYAINEFGLVIHEFDPYFNYRATEYLYAHGWKAFRTWFDYMVWYPLGRPVGTTIYPGMQVTSVWIKTYILQDMSINDICCYVPAWFGVLATLSVAWLTYEATRGPQFQSILGGIPGLAQVHQLIVVPIVRFVLHLLQLITGSTWGIQSGPQSPITPFACAVASACIMSIVPAHILRSVGGGYDNESIAMTAMVLTFASWTASLRDHLHPITTFILGMVTGVAYFYMVAAWGGYVFVLNMVGIHASVLVVIGRYSTKLHRAYTAFYIVGTILAIQVPVVGWQPLKSLEQLGPFVAFGGFQLIEFCEIMKRRYNLNRIQTWKLRIQVFAIIALIAASIAYFLQGTGYFGPFSARIRGLFVKHTKTGNPLVDSVAEHQAASPQAYFQYLHNVVYLLPWGLGVTALFFFNDSSSFLLVYSVASYYFSHRMVRLVLLTAPIASCLGGITIGRLVGWTLSAIIENDTPSTSEKINDKKSGTESKKKGKVNSNNNNNSSSSKGEPKKDDPEATTNSITLAKVLSFRGPIVRIIRVAATIAAAYYSKPHAESFYKISHEMAQALSHPTIVNKGRLQSGETIIVDDYRQAYWWLRDNTPEDSRVMAWWDYGYQITGISNRTTIADGNTWNHEHIALLGRTLTASEREAHRIIRHLADYVLVWAGGGGDDLAKSPHLRRIANSVYRGLCQEPTCRDFGFYSDRSPTPEMEASLLYKLCINGVSPGVEVDRNRFREVYRSQYGKVRIYKVQSVAMESKEWVANPANRLCDAPGSWFCPGQYPPALDRVLKEKRDFKQLEDFNRGQRDEEYTREYFENLNNPDARPKSKHSKSKPKEMKRLADVEIDMINEHWENNEMTTLMWELISKNQIQDLVSVLSDQPQLAHIRAADGRGPMFWAHEYSRSQIIDLLKQLGVSETRTDEKGITPLGLSKK